MSCMVPSIISRHMARLHLYLCNNTNRKRNVYSIEIMYELCMCESLYEIDTVFSCVILREKRGWCKIAEPYKNWFVNWSCNQVSSLFSLSLSSLHNSKMTYMYYASAALLVTFSIYRPFITKLDKVKYGALGGASFLAPFVIDYNNRETTTNQQQHHQQQNMTSLLHLIHVNASNMPVSSATSSQSLFSDAVSLFMLTAFIVSVCGLFTRWHFPITFVKPNASSLVSGFVRHGLSILIILMAITR